MAGGRGRGAVVHHQLQLFHAFVGRVALGRDVHRHEDGAAGGGYGGACGVGLPGGTAVERGPDRLVGQGRTVDRAGGVVAAGGNVAHVEHQGLPGRDGHGEHGTGRGFVVGVAADHGLLAHGDVEAVSVQCVLVVVGGDGDRCRSAESRFRGEAQGVQGGPDVGLRALDGDGPVDHGHSGRAAVALKVQCAVGGSQGHAGEVAVDVGDIQGADAQGGAIVGGQAAGGAVDGRLIGADHLDGQLGRVGQCPAIGDAVEEVLGQAFARLEPAHGAVGRVDRIRVAAVCVDRERAVRAGDVRTARREGGQASLRAAGLGDGLGVAGIHVRVVGQDVARAKRGFGGLSHVVGGHRRVVVAVDGDAEIGPVDAGGDGVLHRVAEHLGQGLAVLERLDGRQAVVDDVAVAAVALDVERTVAPRDLGVVGDAVIDDIGDRREGRCTAIGRGDHAGNKVAPAGVGRGLRTQVHRALGVGHLFAVCRAAVFGGAGGGAADRRIEVTGARNQDGQGGLALCTGQILHRVAEGVDTVGAVGQQAVGVGWGVDVVAVGRECQRAVAAGEGSADGRREGQGAVGDHRSLAQADLGDGAVDGVGDVRHRGACRQASTADSHADGDSAAGGAGAADVHEVGRNGGNTGDRRGFVVSGGQAAAEAQGFRAGEGGVGDLTRELHAGAVGHHGDGDAVLVQQHRAPAAGVVQEDVVAGGDGGGHRRELEDGVGGTVALCRGPQAGDHVGFAVLVDVAVVGEHVARGLDAHRIAAGVLGTVGQQGFLGVVGVVVGVRVVVVAADGDVQAGDIDAAVGADDLVAEGLGQRVAGRAQSLHIRVVVVDGVDVLAVGADDQAAVAPDHGGVVVAAGVVAGRGRRAGSRLVRLTAERAADPGHAQVAGAAADQGAAAGRVVGCAAAVVGQQVAVRLRVDRDRGVVDTAAFKGCVGVVAGVDGGLGASEQGIERIVHRVAAGAHHGVGGEQCGGTADAEVDHDGCVRGAVGGRLSVVVLVELQALDPRAGFDQAADFAPEAGHHRVA